MFKLIYIFLITLSGCNLGNSATAEKKANTEVSPQIELNSALDDEKLGSVITIRTEQTLTYQDLELRLTAVEDSRCAIGVSCIWAGQLIVTLEVTNKYDEKVAVKLIRKRESEIANAFGYSLLLLNVDPHPKKGKTIRLSDQVVEFNIVKTR